MVSKSFITMRFKLFFLAFCLGHIAFGQGTKLIHIPGTNCSLVPPKGFVLVKDASGFIDSATAASIIVAEFPVPYDTLISEFSKENFIKHDGVLLNKELIHGKGYNTILLTAEQTKNGQKYRTLILVFGDDKTAATIIGNYPATSKSMEPVIKQAILTTVHNKPRAGSAGRH